MKTKLRVIGPEAGKPLKRDMVRVRKLSKIFHLRDTRLNVLDNISFEAKEGELVCIVGRSGCGKSTLLNILAGFMVPSSGDVLLEGRRLSRPGPDRCVVFQEDALFPWLTVEENIAFGLKQGIFSHRLNRARLDEYIEMVGLTPFRSYLPSEISGGMKQRVALARVLILDPMVLLMDEPFGALDAQSREEMQKLLLFLWSRLSHTILFVTHDVNEAVLLADRVLVMDSGPGRIRREFHVGLERPRNPESSSFIGLQSRIRRELSDS